MTTKQTSAMKNNGGSAHNEASETDPLQQIAEALVVLIKERQPVASPPVSAPQNSPEPPKVATADVKPAGPKKRERPMLRYPDHYSIRLRYEDRERFDSYAARHRISKGEALQRMLDAVEALEREQEK